jgi:hypothetical protein
MPFDSIRLPCQESGLHVEINSRNKPLKVPPIDGEIFLQRFSRRHRHRDRGRRRYPGTGPAAQVVRWHDPHSHFRRGAMSLQYFSRERRTSNPTHLACTCVRECCVFIRPRFLRTPGRVRSHGRAQIFARSILRRSQVLRVWIAIRLVYSGLAVPLHNLLAEAGPSSEGKCAIGL